ncbi:MAG TPA: argininosuccinate synthase, partial [Thermoanaerobaculia bacterium]|nr:argininosuccinate synthase [Thermoanaerobaculia bacterium]
GGRLEDPAWEPEPSIFRLTIAPEDAPDVPERVAITFEEGIPVAVDGEPLAPAALVQRLNAVGGRHGVGRVDLVENRLVGIKSRGVYETPGGTILVAALRALESITLDRETLHEKERLAIRFAEIVYYGQWFSALRESLDAFFATAAGNVNGTVVVKLFKGHASAVSRTSPTSLFDPALASFDMSGYTPEDAGGFIRLFGLPTRGRRRIAPLEVPARRLAGER